MRLADALTSHHVTLVETRDGARLVTLTGFTSFVVVSVEVPEARLAGVTVATKDIVLTLT